MVFSMAIFLTVRGEVGTLGNSEGISENWKGFKWGVILVITARAQWKVKCC